MIKSPSSCLPAKMRRCWPEGMQPGVGGGSRLCPALRRGGRVPPPESQPGLADAVAAFRQLDANDDGTNRRKQHGNIQEPKSVPKVNVR
jgi:hypothetical protein